MDRVKIAVVGAGRLGGFHADKIAACDKSILAGIYDVDPAAARSAAEKHGVPAFDSLEAAAAAADAVTIAAPTRRHFELGEFFLRRGKHVLLEKPMTVTGSEARALRVAARAGNLVLQTGHTERFNPAWTAALSAIRSISGPAIFDARRISPYTFRCTDVGAVLDIMIHDLELVLSVAASPVRSVDAVSFEEFGGFEDACAAQVLFKDGSLARFFASRVEREAQRTMSVSARGRRVFLDFAARRAEVVSAAPEILDGGYAPEKTVFGEIRPKIPSFMQEHYKTELFEKSPIDPLQEEENLFADSILRGDAAERDRGAEAVELAGRILAACRKNGSR